MIHIKNRVGVPFHWSLFFAAIGALFLICACGKKAPPLPPAHYELPVVEDIASEMVGNELILTWPMPEWDPPEGVELAGFNVYRAKLRLTEACETCPVRFKKAATVEVDRLAIELGSDLEYREKLEKGYHYRYKITAYTHTGEEGADSSAVTINY